MIYHVVEQHGAVGDRIERAKASWKTLYDRGITPVHRSEFAFTSGAMGDARRLPLLTELLDLTAPSHADIVLLTNDDTILHPDLPELLEKKLAKLGAVSSFRLNITNPIGSLLGTKPMVMTKVYKHDFGRDLFAFTVTWLTKHWPSVPMMFLGEIEWDIIMAILIRRSLGMTPQHNWQLHHKSPAELPLGYVLHEKHETLWRSAAFAMNPAKEWNRAVARAWYRDNKLEHLCTV